MNQHDKSIIEPFPRQIAEISTLLSNLQQQEQAIEASRRNRDARQQHESQAESLRRQLLTKADFSLIYHYLEATSIADKNAFRTAWQQNLPYVSNQEWLDFIQPSLPDLSVLPFGSFFIQFEFKLLKPYISRDDNPFYIVDNPIVREKVFRYPMVRATAWKGSLCHALWQMGYQKEDEGDKGEQVQRLFGTANDEKPDDGKSGRLYFYPSFFDKVGLEVINPHDREKKAGTVPVLLESVPTIDAQATFTLLYAPLDCIGKNEADPSQQVFDDLQLVAEGLQAMFSIYGFGAKTSSGFGLADVTGEGQLVVHYPDKKAQNPKPQEPTSPKAVHDFLAKYPAEYLDMKPKQLKEAGVPNELRQQTKEIKTLHQQYQQDLAQHKTELAEWETIAAKPSPKTTTRPFISFTALSDTVTNINQTGGDA
jgi:CRISPR-associated protein Cmr2